MAILNAFFQGGHLRILSLIAPIFFLVLLACSSGDLKDSNTAEAAFKEAETYDADERYEEALQKYKEVQNKHPYSRYAVEAKIRIADVYFKRESFIEAQNAYQLVKDLHPKHPRVDYVTFRLGLSYYSQLPSTIDRDLSLAHKAIIYFDEVIKSYSKSTYVKEAQEKKADALKMLVGKEIYIAAFYYKRDMYDSALGRYEELLTIYPNSVYQKEALFGAAMSALKNGDMDKSKIYAEKLSKSFPESSESKQVQGELSQHGLH